MIGAVLPRSADLVIVGAGVVGAACAAALARAGMSVCVLDRAGPAAGASSAGEGNLLVSDKLPGPELALAQSSLALWREFAGRAAVPVEFDAKGGLVVAASPAALDRLAATVAGQRAAGVRVEEVAADRLPELEARLAPDLAGGAYYPQDAQVQPMLAVRALLAEATRAGAVVVAGAEALAADRDAAGAIRALRTSRGTIATERVLLAAGAWSGELSRALGGAVRVVPRRGHVVVTEPLPPIVRHKVYEAGYLDDVESDMAGLLSSAVVEGTESGPILLGSSRELVGFDRRPNLSAVAAITRRVVALFPFLRDVRAIRTYLGFRPASPDHLPIIGAEDEAPGLWYATGHEGAGVGLALGTADLVRALVCGEPPPLDPAPFSPSRPGVRREVVRA